MKTARERFDEAFREAELAMEQVVAAVDGRARECARRRLVLAERRVVRAYRHLQADLQSQLAH